MPVLRIYLAIMFVGIVLPLAFASGQDADFLISRFNLVEQVPAALTMLIVGMACTITGYAIPLSQHSPFRNSDLSLPMSVALAAWAVFFGIILLLLIAGGDVVQNIELLLRKTRGVVGAQNIIYFLMPFLVAQSSLIAILYINDRGGGSKLTVLLVCLLTATICFLVGSRMRAVLTLAVPFMYFGFRDGVRLLYVVVSGVFALAIVYIGEIVRRLAQGRDATGGDGPIATFASSFSIVDPMALVMVLEERMPMTPLDALETLVKWSLPTSIVGAKEWIGPISARYIFFGDTSGGITLGIYGEFYYYFGLAGLIMLSVLFGIGLRLLRYRSEERTVTGALAFVILSYLLLSSIRNGLFIDFVDFIAISLVFFINWWLHLRKITGRRLASK